MSQSKYDPAQRWKLPPLILHPFADSGGPSKLVESSRASLILQGLLPNSEFSQEQLDRTLLDGRFCEVRMVYYVGKDLVRWIEQCMEFVARDERLRSVGIRLQSFASLLIDDAPVSVQEKLTKWGVADYKAIFSRAIGLNTIFAEAPDQSILTEDFIRNYYRYADRLFEGHQGAAVFAPITSQNFVFELYASGEYSRMLEREWQET